MMNIRKKIWKILVNLYPQYLRNLYKMDIGDSAVISWTAHLDKSVNPKGIHIGKGTWVLREAMILSHDHCRKLKTDTRIGENCIVGIRSIILPVEKVPYNLEEFGNLGGASIPSLMVTRLREQLQTKENTLLMSSFGIGLSWGTMMIKSLPMVVSELIEL